MDVNLFDGRVGTWRERDVPKPLKDELTLSYWTPDPNQRGVKELAGTWRHDVYQRTSDRSYRFIGTAPSDTGKHGDLSRPMSATTLWPGPLRTE